MRRCVLSSRLPVVLLAASAALPACNAVFGVEPGTRVTSGSGGSASDGSASTTSNAGDGGGGSPSASSTGGGGSAGAGAGDSFSYPGEVRWAFTPSDVGGIALGAAYDASGDKIFVGGFNSYSEEGEAGGDFGDGPLLNGGAQDAFVVKYGPSGEIRWTRTLSGPGDQRAHGVAVDAAGNVLVTGRLGGSASFPGGAELTVARGPEAPDDTSDI
ncbi:hypothetical protein WMF38_26435 [Sorangium sp. So ce118]